MATVIILNGPAGSGKDTIANKLADASPGNRGMWKVEFKSPLYVHTAQAIGMDYDEFMENYQDRDWKEEPQFNGRSVRDIMIATSEAYLKPLFGNNYFGTRLAESINASRYYADRWGVVVSDGGFVEEVEALCDANLDVVLIHLYRDGCSFDGDSRNYVLTNKVRRIYTLENNGSVEDAVAEVERILDDHRSQ